MFFHFGLASRMMEPRFVKYGRYLNGRATSIIPNLWIKVMRASDTRAVELRKQSDYSPASIRKGAFSTGFRALDHGVAQWLSGYVFGFDPGRRGYFSGALNTMWVWDNWYSMLNHRKAQKKNEGRNAGKVYQSLYARPSSFSVLYGDFWRRRKANILLCLDFGAHLRSSGSWKLILRTTLQRASIAQV